MQVVLDDDKVAQTKEEASSRVEDAIAFAKDSATPDPASATSYVFS